MCKDYQKDFEAGLYTKVRPDRFDSVSEKKVCLILNRILKDYGLEKMMQIRLTPQQALDNYVEVKVTDDKYGGYLENRNKWMKFDFIFERVYEYKNEMHYIPVAVVEFDGLHHDAEKQKRLDAYKNGVASNIGAQMIRIRYEDLKPENEEQLRELYEETIVMGIIKGFFTRTVNFRKSGDLITEKNQKHFDYLVDQYKKALQVDGENIFYQKMLQWLYTSKELGAVSAN